MERHEMKDLRNGLLAPALVGAILLFAGCGAGASSGNGDGRPAPTRPTSSEPTVILEDDFSDLSTGWVAGGRFEGANSVQEITGGALRVFIKTPRGRGGPDSTGLDVDNAADLESLADTSIEVSATRKTDPRGHLYAVLCRLQDFDNFYGFALVDGGRYSIFKEVDGVGTDLASGASELVSGAPTAKNRLRADCVGKRLVFSVDGHEVAEAHDSQFESGAMGLLAETRGEAGLEVLFDDLVIRSATGGS